MTIIRFQLLIHLLLPLTVKSLRPVREHFLLLKLHFPCVLFRPRTYQNIIHLFLTELLRNTDGIGKIFNRPQSADTHRIPIHITGIKLHNLLLIWQTAVTNRFIIRKILHRLNSRLNRLAGGLPLLQHLIRKLNPFLGHPPGRYNTIHLYHSPIPFRNILPDTPSSNHFPAANSCISTLIYAP